jgi:hypothetical protein
MYQLTWRHKALAAAHTRRPTQLPLWNPHYTRKDTR